MKLHRNIAFLRVSVFSLPLIAFGLACDPPKQEAEGSSVAEKELPLLAPEEKKHPSVSRCLAKKGWKEPVLRARSGSGKDGGEAVEVGAAILSPAGVFVGGLRTGSSQSAFLFVADGKGREREVDLGKVHGSVEPPEVLAHEDSVLVAVFDNDAGNRLVRVAKVERAFTDPHVSWGPSFSRTRDESVAFSWSLLGGSEEPLVAVVWDETSQASLRSEIFSLTFSPQTLQVKSRKFLLSPRDLDAGSPQLSQSAQGAFLTFVIYAAEVSKSPRKSNPDADPEDSLGQALVEEPSQSLAAMKLGVRGEPITQPLALSATSDQVAVFDSAMKGEGLLVAFRLTQDGSPVGESPINTRLVGTDGSVTSGQLSSPFLGPGAPLLFSGPAFAEPWLFSRGQEQEVLAAGLDRAGAQGELQLESQLEDYIPAGRWEDSLLALQPDGLDFRFALFSCKLK